MQLAAVGGGPNGAAVPLTPWSQDSAKLPAFDQGHVLPTLSSHSGQQVVMQAGLTVIYIYVPYMCNLLDGLVALGCYEGFEGHGSANGLPQPRMELAERSHEQTYLG